MGDPIVERVDLGPRSYEIRVVAGAGGEFAGFASASLGATWAGKSCRYALFVSDENVSTIARSYGERLMAAGLEVEHATIPPGEGSKSFEQIGKLWDHLVGRKADRHACVVAVGGGVVGDLAGFAAATYARGLPLLMIPTSLLAMVDSSVGGKVGINHPRAKNIIGAFHQPIGVWIDTETLATLPPRELRCGLAEVVKYGVILDAEFFDRLESEAGSILEDPMKALPPIIARCCRLKADVVERDEREETGLRAVLNFGHTIGHAIEAVAGYGGGYQHGEAVAVGMVAESALAERLGWIGPEVTARLKTLLERLGLPTSAPGLAVDSLIDAMGRDKKNRSGRVRFVLPRRIGHVELTDAAELPAIRAELERMTA